MNKILIKICGITDPETAAATAQAGADFMGLIFFPKSRRYVGLEQATLITRAVKEGGSIPVAVFVNQSADEMLELCEATGIETVQLHGDRPRAEHHLLPRHYRRIYVSTVSPAGIIDEDRTGGLAYCQPQRDYRLFDNTEGGKGQVFDWEQFTYMGSLPWGLAGGLNQDNVAIALAKYPLNLVDVSSGVEDSQGRKDIDKIRAFIRAVR